MAAQNLLIYNLKKNKKQLIYSFIFLPFPKKADSILIIEKCPYQ